MQVNTYNPLNDKRTRAEKKHCRCVGCGKDTFLDDKDYYMVQFHIWEKHGVGKNMLCMDCIEERIGHKLTKEDILPCILTEHMNYYTKQILNS